MEMILLFGFCTALNVILSTIRSVQTIKGTKSSAALWNAISFGLYSYLVVLTATADITTWQKIVITALCNLVCVYGVKWTEEKMRKDKLWKLEVTIPEVNKTKVISELENAGIPFNYIDNVGKYVIFNIYCATQKETTIATYLAEFYKGKAFASETKLM